MHLPRVNLGRQDQIGLAMHAMNQIRSPSLKEETRHKQKQESRRELETSPMTTRERQIESK